MAKDYKAYSSKKKARKKVAGKSTRGSSKTSQASKSKRVGLWLVVAVLLVLFGFVLYWLSQHHDSKQKMKPVAVKKVVLVQPVQKLVLPKIKFEFYNMLTNAGAAPAQPDTVNVPQAKVAIANYIVQVASLKNPKDADSIKAKLVLDGFNVNITQTKNSSGTTWFRVQIGPFNNFDDAYDTQNRLRKNHFDGLIKKVT
jgi:cell division protein FtsN